MSAVYGSLPFFSRITFLGVHLETGNVTVAKYASSVHLTDTHQRVKIGWLRGSPGLGLRNVNKSLMFIRRSNSNGIYYMLPCTRMDSAFSLFLSLCPAEEKQQCVMSSSMLGLLSVFWPFKARRQNNPVM